MVRRRSSKRDGQERKTKLKPLKRSDSKLQKWNTIEDIPMDEEDQFHHNRDKILLEGENAGGFDDDLDDDEVFALKGVSDSDDDREEDYEQYEGATEGSDDVVAADKTSNKLKKGKKAKGKKVDKDEEEEEEEEEEESWGRGRGAYYASNIDELESDDEEGNELEEQEAKRLQVKTREALNDDDFGLEDNPEFEKENQDESLDITDSVPSVLPPQATDKISLLRHLEKTSPESIALARDWEDTVQSLQKTKSKIEDLKSSNPNSMGMGMLHMYYQALLSYSTVLAFYLHLRSSAKYVFQPALLQSHPILQRLLSLKQALQTMEDLDFTASDPEDDDDEGEDFEGSITSMGTDEMLADGEKLWSIDHESGLDSDELEELLDEAKEAEVGQYSPPKIDKPQKKRSKTKEQEKVKVIKPVFDLVEPEFVASKPSKMPRDVSELADAYGDAMSLHTVDAADKSARKKSLRFHTSKIDSATARRQNARNQAAGGDDDIPYRERKSAKEARLVKEAATRAQNQAGAPLDDEEPVAGKKRSRADDDEGGSGDESPDDYYELVKKQSQQKKVQKKAEYEAASGRGRVSLEDSESSGPRLLTRAILANKGLTPHRPKSVRNPRVKKRLKFEKAKKKIASQKSVYKGGLSESGGRYDGERSGISKVVKSVPLA